MGKTTGIAWCDHTFNPWAGCFKVSDGCKNCYASSIANRFGWDVFGPAATTPRRLFGEPHWQEPIRWNAEATRAGESRRVFCASMADVFEDHPMLDTQRTRLWYLIRDTPMLDWLLLTKRPENVTRMAPWGNDWPENVWLGTSVEDQRRANERLPVLAGIPARTKFISAEPLLERVVIEDLLQPGDVHWLIIGGESGPGARPFNAAWLNRLMADGRFLKMAIFVKQFGSNPLLPLLGGETVRLRFHAHKGDDPTEWMSQFQAQEFPRERRSAVLV